jgi:hypothetical protein
MILDELAFDTSVDLERARVILLAAWSVLAASGTAGLSTKASPKALRERTKAPAERDPRAAIADFDRARRSGAELDEVFRKLERDLRLEDVTTLDARTGGDNPVLFPRRCRARSCRSSSDRSHRSALARRVHRPGKLGRFGASIGLIEELDATTILRFATFWLLEYDELASTEEARDIVVALELFCRWAETAHGLDLAAVHEPLATLHESLPRIWRANRERARSSSDDPGELVEVLSIESAGEAELRDASGAFRATRIVPDMARELQPGDRLRARFQGDDHPTILCCYPPEIAILAAS